MRLPQNKIGLGLALKHAARMLRPRNCSTAGFIGVLLLLTNVPFGYGGAAICAAIGVRTKAPVWGAAGVGVYILSWGMLILGVFLAGKETAQKIKKRLPQILSARKRANDIWQRNRQEQ